MPPAQCSCFLPSCADCCPRRPSGDLSHEPCACCLPTCGICRPSETSRPLLSGSGIHQSARTYAIIASVDAQLRRLLDLPGAHNGAFLRRGESFGRLPTSHESSPAGTRHDHLVAHLCGVRVTTVQAARKACEQARAEKRPLPLEAARRGPKRRDDSEEHSPSPSPVAGPGVEDGAIADPWQPSGWQVLCGVPGHYLKTSPAHASAHSTALTLGRLYAMAAVENIPDTVCQRFLSQLHLSGARVGQKHHGIHAISAFTGILARLCTASARSEFWGSVPNLSCPSAWRLIFDGVTLQNGTTVRR
jgi:hypothetical protein